MIPQLSLSVVRNDMQNNRHASAMVVLLGTLSLVGLAGQRAIEPREDGGPYTHTKFNYKVRYPSTWRLVIAPNGDFTIFNFAQEKSGHGVLLPEHGATISISVQNDSKGTIDRWIRKDVWGELVETRKIVKVENLESNGPKSFIEVSWKWEVGPGASLREVADYFVLKNAAFKAHLTYWEGDSQSALYRSILHRVVSTVSVGPGKE